MKALSKLSFKLSFEYPNKLYFLNCLGSKVLVYQKRHCEEVLLSQDYPSHNRVHV